MKNKKLKKGFVLVTALLFDAILLIIAIAFVSRVATECRLIGKIYNATAALNLAEAGAERALWELSYNSSAFTGWNTSTDTSGNKTMDISVNGFQNHAGTAIGDYTVSAWVSSDGMNATVTSTGYVPRRTSPDETRTVKITYVRHNFGKGVVGLNGITMSGQARTDGYDSSRGPYNPNPNDPSYNWSQDGSIASNGAISLGSNVYVYGDANPGYGYPFTGTPPVSGSYGTLSAPVTVDPIPASAVTAAKTANSNSTITYSNGSPFNLVGYDLSISGSTSINIGAGTYYFTSISSTGQSSINVTGAAIVYIDGGSVSISGQGIVNSTGLPKNLQLYSTGNNISLSGQAAFAGAIYAPSATVTLTGQENFYGSLICGSNVDSGQAAIHYDVSLSNVSPVFANNRVTSWQELNQ